MASGFILPAGYERVKIVSSFDELVGTPFANGVNALCWQRQLEGDFEELAMCFKGADEIVPLDQDALAQLRPQLSAQGHRAAEAMLADYRLLSARGLLPSIECVPAYPRDEDAVLSTDVYSYHADRSPIATDTYLCTYAGAATEALRNEETQRHIDIPATRAALFAQFVQEEGDAGDFEAYLRENCYDLHYAPVAGAVPFSFGIGHLWRIAIEYPACPVPPCIHRAPLNAPGALPRLLLIS